MSYFWQRGGTSLRPLQPSDVEAYLAADRDSEGKRVLNYSIGLPRSLHSQAELLPIHFKAAPERLDFAIENASGSFVGFAALNKINEQNGTFSTVTFILPTHRRLGHGERSKLMMLDYMFNERRFQKYHTHCLEYNEPIQSHLRKLGCQQEGRRRRQVFTNGRYYDQILFGLTREEFLQHCAPLLKRTGD